MKRFCYEFARNPRRGSVDADVLAFNDVFLLVDDIYTTGATMDEAGAALVRAGVRQVFFLTVCIGHGQS